ncbi:thioesterase family protein [Undibacterium cyanobacteriorum]|uniref:Thioesterase family protein n=1 Tax=Undibacterium cyanobacteriorum TaxID=3073561 RepID=A0ABY9RDL2_9BURK|nr:thioesterase family protein [Undibacterium sp. 20NA77.5]WMW79308.1 thioesterase family protein [Undibacterium sp. 20NA77.5]
MSFEQMIAQARLQSEVEVLEGWGQGRALFGGLLGAMVLAHLEGKMQDRASASATQLGPVIRALTISFVAPVEVGQLEIQSEVLRAGKSVIQMQCTMRQHGQVVLSALASFGMARSSSVVVESWKAPDIGAPGSGQAIPYFEGIVPEFTRKIDFRITGCDLPFSGSSRSHMDGWMRWNARAGVTTEKARLLDLVALIDAWPPAILQMLKQPNPASSLTWTLEFPAIDDAVLSEAANPWWQYRAQTESARNGYGHIAAHIWDESGRLVAISRQTVTVFG